VCLPPIGAGPLLRRNLLDLWRRRHHHSVCSAFKAIAFWVTALHLAWENRHAEGNPPAIVLVVRLDGDHRPPLNPLAMTGIAGNAVSLPGAGKPDREGRQGHRFGADRSSLWRDNTFPKRPAFPKTNTPDPKDPTKTVDAPYNAANSGWLESRPTNKALADRRQRRCRQVEGKRNSPRRFFPRFDSGDHVGKRP